MLDIKKPEVLFRVIFSLVLIIGILEVVILNFNLDKQKEMLAEHIEKENETQAALARNESINKDYFSQINNLKKEIKEISNRNEELSFILKKITDKANSRNTKVEEMESNKTIPSTINAKIIASIPEQNLVMLSVGKADNVKVGYKFTVFRGGDYLGKVEIIEIHPNMSAGRVLVELNNTKGLKIERGDDAQIGL